MNKFEKKAMAKRAYRALVKMGGGDPYSKRISPDMMTPDEFTWNGTNGINNPKYPLGEYAAFWNNVNVPKDDIHSSSGYQPQRERPFGPLWSLDAAKARYSKMGAPDPITKRNSLREYLLTGGRQYVPDSIKLDDTPY